MTKEQFRELLRAELAENGAEYRDLLRPIPPPHPHHSDGETQDGGGTHPTIPPPTPPGGPK